MIFAAYFALFFYLWFVGVLLPFPKQDRVDDFALGLFARSMFVSWIVVWASFFLELPNQIGFLSLLAVTVLLYRAPRKMEVDISHNPIERNALVFSLLLAGVVITALALGGFDNANTPTFQEWDAIVSWNRWAAQLSQNRYLPYNAAYPILFPGLWSLIYKAQGNAQLWVIAKYSLLVLPVLLLFPLIRLLSQRLYWSAVIYTAICYFVIFKFNFAQIFTGYMDMPVAIMMLVSSLWLYFSIDDREEINTGTLSVAVTLCGLAAITKQAGALMLAPALYLIAAAVLKKQITALQAGGFVLLTVTPLTTFTLMLFSAKGEIIGNLEGLADSAAASTATLGTDSNIAASALLMRQALSDVGLIVLCCLAALNIFNVGRLAGQLGIIFAALALVGFVIFANCCSYHVRNGWWIFSLLACSAIIGVRGFESSISVGRKSKPFRVYAAVMVAIGTALVFAYAVSTYETPDAVRARQAESQFDTVPPDLKRGLKIALTKLGPTGKLISAMQVIQFLPGFEQKYQFCENRMDGCVAKAIEAHPSSIVLMSPHEIKYAFDDFGHRFTSDKMIGSFDKFQLYGPYP